MNWTHIARNNTPWQRMPAPVISSKENAKVHVDSFEAQKLAVMAQWEEDIAGWYKLVIKAGSHEKRCWLYYLYCKARRLCKNELTKLYYPNAQPDYPMDTWELDEMDLTYDEFPILPDPLSEIEDRNYNRYFPDDDIASPSDLDDESNDPDDSEPINDGSDPNRYFNYSNSF